MSVINPIYWDNPTSYMYCTMTVHRQVGRWLCRWLCGDLQAQKKSMIIHDTEYPYWNKVALNNTKLKLKLIV